MRPYDFKYPFSWENRAPTIADHVLFIPKHYNLNDGWIFPRFEDSVIFGRIAPIWIEYCTGNGAWIIEQALAHPDRNWIAVEKRFDRVQKIWSKMKNNALNNLFIVCGDALQFTKTYLQEQSVEGIYINFPDPWPKFKHVKHRLLQAPFVAEMARVSTKHATTTIVTDDDDYTARICQAMLSTEQWKPVFPEPYYITEWEGYGSSYFEQLWREKGKTIHFMQFGLS